MSSIMKNGLSNKQFVVIALVIMLSGIAIFGNDYVKRKRDYAVENISVVFEENTGPEIVEPVIDTNVEPSLDGSSNNNNTVTPTLDSNSNTNNQSNPQNTTVSTSDQNHTPKKQTNSKYNYVGRLKIPKINLDKRFVQAPSGKKGLKCVDQNVCAYSGDNNYPDRDGSHLILGAHNGSGWNAFFTRIDKLKIGNFAYIEYKNKVYKYKLVNTYKDGKGDLAISFRSNGANKQLSLFTCARPNYNKYYLILSFKLVAEENM